MRTMSKKHVTHNMNTLFRVAMDDIFLEKMCTQILTRPMPPKISCVFELLDQKRFCSLLVLFPK